MLYVYDDLGKYDIAPEEVIMKEAVRISNNVLASDIPITNKSLAMNAIGAQLCGREDEAIGCLFMNASHKVLGWEILFTGTVNKAVAYPRVFVKKALGYNAAAIIIAHNHPSGSITPSREDLSLTGVIIQALEFIDVAVLDHLIVGSEVVSLADQGHLASIRSRIAGNLWKGEL